MKTKVLLLPIFLLIITSVFGQFQKSVQVVNKHHHDLNIEPLDGVTDYIVAGNLFDNSLQNEEMVLKKVDDSGNIIWYNKYSGSTLQHLRSFDIVTYLDFIFVTGSVDVNGLRKTFIAKIDALNGSLLDARYYDIVPSTFNSRGLHIEFTQSDADGDGASDPGLVVGGFFSDCYTLDPSCVDNNIGFVLRVDLNLNIIWTVEVDTNLSTNPVDYDFINGITETSDGFFITGSATGPIGGGYQQAVLAYKIDFMGVFAWNNSYIFGNSQDVSVDAYYDTGSDKIYMLTNYSVSHYFGVTVFDNVPGTVDLGRSWYITNNDLNRYGFTIMESYTDGNNLIITGYDRDENWVDGNNNSLYGETNLFVHEFQKLNGNQVGTTYQYLVPNIEPSGDDFNFWLYQMPLIYYPDISFIKDFPGTNGDYYHVGYRRDPAGGFVESELVRTPTSRVNNCDFLALALAPVPPTFQTVPVLSGFVPNAVTSFVVNNTALSYTQEMCVRTLASSENTYEKAVLYPNPASEIVYVRSENIQSYRIVDSLGRIVYEDTLNSERSIYIGNLKNGLYFIEVYDHSKKGQTFKLIKH